MITDVAETGSKIMEACARSLIKTVIINAAG